MPTVQLRDPAIQRARYSHPPLGRGSGTVTDHALIHRVCDLITTSVTCRVLHGKAGAFITSFPAERDLVVPFVREELTAKAAVRGLLGFTII